MDVIKNKLKINFKTVISQLVKDGWTQVQLAEFAGVTRGRISQLAAKDGIDPSYTVGDKLLALLTPVAHIRIVGYTRTYRGTTQVKAPDIA
jgi:predicted XRE-type DNA-binding protein